MSFLELAKKRHSVRAYRPDPVSDELLNQVLEAGRIAPSAQNLQPFQFVVVREKNVLNELVNSYRFPWFSQAPAIIVICTKKDRAFKRIKFDGKCYAEIDAAIAIDHMTLAAAELGLGTCWVAAFNPQIVRDTLNIPAEAEPVIMLTLGYSAEEHFPEPRRELGELVYHEKWPAE